MRNGNSCWASPRHTIIAGTASPPTLWLIIDFRHRSPFRSSSPTTVASSGALVTVLFIGAYPCNGSLKRYPLCFPPPHSALNPPPNPRPPHCSPQKKNNPPPRPDNSPIIV